MYRTDEGMRRRRREEGERIPGIRKNGKGRQRGPGERLESEKDGIQVSCKDTGCRGKAELEVGVREKNSKTRAKGGFRPIGVDMGASSM